MSEQEGGSHSTPSKSDSEGGLDLVEPVGLPIAIISLEELSILSSEFFLEIHGVTDHVPSGLRSATDAIEKSVRRGYYLNSHNVPGDAYEVKATIVHALLIVQRYRRSRRRCGMDGGLLSLSMTAPDTATGPLVEDKEKMARHSVVYLAALNLALHYWNEEHYQVKSWAEWYQVPLQLFEETRVELLRGVGWRIHATDEELNSFCDDMWTACADGSEPSWGDVFEREYCNSAKCEDCGEKVESGGDEVTTKAEEECAEDSAGHGQGIGSIQPTLEPDEEPEVDENPEGNATKQPCELACSHPRIGTQREETPLPSSKRHRDDTDDQPEKGTSQPDPSLKHVPKRIKHSYATQYQGEELGHECNAEFEDDSSAGSLQEENFEGEGYGDERFAALEEEIMGLMDSLASRSGSTKDGAGDMRV